MKSRSRSSIKVLPLLSLILLAAIGLAVWQISTRNNTTTLIPASHEQVIKTANNYVIGKVGQAHFDKWLKAEPNRNSFADNSDSEYDFIAYHFNIEGLNEQSGDSDIIMIQVSRNDLDKVYDEVLPDCSKRNNQCLFEINLSEAKDIARKNGLSGNDLITSYTNKFDEYAKKRDLPFTIAARSCSQKRAIYIDYRDGSVIKDVSEQCPQLD